MSILAAMVLSIADSAMRHSNLGVVIKWLLLACKNDITS